jgi:16S rRNA processing protein RimM
MNKRILVGKIISAFGIKGEVKILSFLEDYKKIEKYHLFDANGNSLKIKISNKSKTVIGRNAAGEEILQVKIDDVDDRNMAEKMRGQEIFTAREDFSKLAKNEFYYVDLVGLDVVDLESKKIGKVIKVFDHGAGGIIEIEFEKSDSKKNLEKIENFPFKKAIFPEINLEKKFIKIDLPEIVK